MSIKLNISGMTCGHCQTAVSNALKSVAGVQNAEVNLEQGTAIVNGENLDTNQLIAAVLDEGYTAQMAA